MTTTTDGRRDATVSFLREHAAGTTPHLFGDLLSHLVGVEELVRAWGGSDVLAMAALGHATYGTDGFEPHLLELDERSVLRQAIGEEAEELVYFYASCDRGVFYPQLTSGSVAPADLVFRDRFTGAEYAPASGNIRQFVDLTYANEAELASSSPGGPAEWTWLVDFCLATRGWASPSFFAGAAALLQDPG